MSASDQDRIPAAPDDIAAPLDDPASHAEGSARLCHLMDLDPQDGTPEAAELDALAASIFAYEEGIFPIEPPTSEEARRFREEQERARGA